MRKTTANRAIVAGGNCIEEITKFRDDMDKVAVHRENVAALCCLITIPQCPSHAIRGLAVNQRNLRFLQCELPNDIRRAIAAVVVDENDFPDVVPICLEQGRDERANVHLLVMTGHNDGGGTE